MHVSVYERTCVSTGVLTYVRSYTSMYYAIGDRTYVHIRYVRTCVDTCVYVCI